MFCGCESSSPLLLFSFEEVDEEEEAVVAILMDASPLPDGDDTVS